MASDADPSSHVSLISLDPAVATHIAAESRPAAPAASSPPPPPPTAHDDGANASPDEHPPARESDPAKRHIRNHSAPSTSTSAAGKKETSSLRRAKNSTEMLRQRSNTSASRKTKSPDAAAAAAPDTRGGRNFTVGSVGTGGILYLRPSAQQLSRGPPGPSSPDPPVTPLTAPAQLQDRDLADDAFPTTTSAAASTASSSQTRSTSSRHRARPLPAARVGPQPHGRSQSFSTVEDQRQSVSATPNAKTLRIIINRPDGGSASHPDPDAAEPADHPLLPTLEVPIPHYRIGRFRFSAHGTPVLRSSAYTRASATPSDLTITSTLTQTGPRAAVPPTASTRAFVKLSTQHPRSGRPSRPTSANTSASVATVIRPEVFEQLAAVYDDPSVVRYSQNVREITAATPARIIAQISSDSFMDYELVSDFFLTFRSYMSTYDVLDLLLARLRWAIGRLEDDGRIIRVRTFAALRHWILNYFTDDFLVDDALRARFCADINRLYADVKASPDNGFSDLKLLRDLKRCWNGRCALWWNPAEFEIDGDQDNDIRPGGKVALEPPQLHVDLPAATPRGESVHGDVVRGPTNSWFEAEATARPVPSPAHSSAAAAAAAEQPPPSLLSDGSLQAGSCFVPTSRLKPAADVDYNLHAPHPVSVSVQSRRKNAPANLQVVTKPTLAPLAPKSLGHRKGASSIDSNREPTTAKDDAGSPALLMEDQSIIRGHLYSPSAPFVQIVSSLSVQSIDAGQIAAVRAPARRDAGPSAAAPPAPRNIFGSLRKVLGSKNGQVDMTLLAVAPSTQQELQVVGRKSSLPLNVSKSHDELRRKPPPIGRKGELRIDLLCAAVCQNYETNFLAKHRLTYGALWATQAALQDGDEAMRTSRLASHTTAQSGSILIVDGTALDGPLMSGGLGVSDVYHPQQDARLLIAGDPSHDVPGGRSASVDIATQRSSNVLPHAADLADDHDSDASGDHDAAEHPPLSAALENAMVPHAQTSGHRPPSIDGHVEAAPDPVDDPAAEPRPTVPLGAGDDAEVPSIDGDASESDVQPAQTLRRRPGGNLRRAENVHDLDATRRASFRTSGATSASGSPHESLLIMKTETAERRGPPPEKAVSMINTHSSQHLRPSFEAAVAGFQAIPDDDDGGLEATLMKLEGRYEKKSPPIDQHPIDMAEKRRSLPELNLGSQRDHHHVPRPLNVLQAVARPLEPQATETVNELASDGSPWTPPAPVADEQPDAEPHRPGEAGSSRRSSIFGLPTESVADSEESYGSLPLLQRKAGYGSAVKAMLGDARPNVAAAPVAYVAPGYFAQDPPQLFHLPKGPPPSATKHRFSFPRPSTADESARSFLLDEDENLSDLSSEISVDIINYANVAERSVSPMLAAPGTALSGLEIPAHPLTYASMVNLHADDPPDTVSHAVPRVPDARAPARPPQHASNTSAESRRAHDPSPASSLLRLPTGPAHIPFVLACDSQLLAQQMTLVEKSALCEVEWSDLVDMRWVSKAAEVSDWVDCLTSATIEGIDLVITRFNLVVKWALSEIVLTQDVHERARVITKFIHVAAHARRLHNYATMLQLTIALTSTDCTRLAQTWSIISAPDKSLLKHMESLVQPIRNFHDLRLEMESADLSDGCIPFIGLYIHDLTYNAQKPTHLPGGRGSESLINFERYRTTAVIVKGLLRLIDASTRYSFDPVPGVIERCLWVAALGDERIRQASKALES